MNNLVKRLNGWHRIGLLLSALWMAWVGAVSGHTYYSRSIEIERPVPGGEKRECPKDVSKSNFECFFGEPNPNAFRHQPTERIRVVMLEERALMSGEFFLTATIVAIGGPAIAWGFAYLCIYAFRWVAAGFKAR